MASRLRSVSRIDGLTYSLAFCSRVSTFFFQFSSETLSLRSGKRWLPVEDGWAPRRFLFEDPQPTLGPARGQQTWQSRRKGPLMPPHFLLCSPLPPPPLPFIWLPPQLRPRAGLVFETNSAPDAPAEQSDLLSSPLMSMHMCRGNNHGGLSCQKAFVSFWFFCCMMSPLVF